MRKATLKRQLQVLASLVLMIFASNSARATTCANAGTISHASLPITAQSLSCGATNDLSATTVTATCGAATGYYGGREALYSYTASSTGFITISYTGQTWTSIIVFNGCPTSGGTCVTSFGNSSSTKTLTDVPVTAGNTYYIWFDVFPSPPSPCSGTFNMSFSSCGSITASAPSLLSSTRAQFGWAAPTNGDTYTIEYGVGSFTQGTGTTISGISTTPYILTGLTSGTGYTYFIRRNCTASGNGQSSWSARSSTFTPSCATISTVTPSVFPTSASFNFSSVTLFTGDSLDIEYGVGSFVQGTGTRVRSGTNNFTISGLTTGTGYTYFVRRACAGGTSNWSIRSSTFTPTCATINTVTSTILGPTSARLNFSTVILQTGDSIEVEYGLGTFTQGTGTFVRSGVNNFVLSGLTAASGYTYFVRRICAGGGGSTWSVRSSTFTTSPANTFCANAVSLGAACAGSPVSGTTTGTVVDSSWFDAGTGGTLNAQRGVWYKYVGDDNNVSITTCNATGYDSRISVYSGACGSLTAVTGNDDMGATCTSSTLRSLVSFDAYSGTDYYVYIHGYQFGTSASNTGNFVLTLNCTVLCTPIVNNGTCATATNLSIPTSCNNLSLNNNCAPTALSAPPGTSAFGTYPNMWYTFTAPSEQVIFKTTYSGTATNVGVVVDSTCNTTRITKGSVASMVDGQQYALSGLTVGGEYKVQLFTPIANKGSFEFCAFYDPCPTPLNGTVGSVTSTSAALSWTSTGANFDVEVLLSGSTPTGVPTDSVVPNGFVKTGLSGSTDYVYYVRRNCGGGLYSTWNGPYNFSTLIDCSGSPVISCSTPVNVSLPSGTGNWDAAICGFGTPGKERVFRFTPLLTGDHYIVQSSSFGYIDYMIADSATAACDENAWTCIADLTGASNSPTFSLTAGVTYYILADPEGTAGGNYSFTVACPLLCSDPSALASTSVGHISAIFNWTAGDTETEWDIYYGATPITTPTLSTTPTIQNVSTRPYTLTGLTATTSYRLWVRADCGGGDTSNWIGPVNFTTTATPPANDSCVSATVIGCGGTYTGTTVNATQDEYTTDCGAGGAPTSQKGVWFVYTATDDSTITASLCGSSYDSRITVYRGTCGALTCVGGNDDFCGTRSEVVFNALAGNTYYIMVHAFGATSGGAYTLNVTCSEYIAPPVNDECASARTATMNPNGTCTTVMAVNTTAATPSLGVSISCVFFATLYDVWHKFTPNTSRAVVRITNITAANTGFQVFSACGGTQIACQATAISGTDYTITGLTPGTEYIIRSFNEGGDQGTYSLCMQQGPPPPSNDDCSGATLISCGTVIAGSTQYATLGTEGSIPTCGTSITSQGVWYRFIGNGANVTVSTCGAASWDTKINVFRGNCGSLVCVGGNDDNCGLQSTVSFATSSGVNYYILVQGAAGASGSFTLTAACTGLNTWLGVNSTWSNPANWTLPFIPSGCSDRVIIPSTSSNPVISSDLTLRDVTLSSGATITLNSANLNICGDWYGDGTLLGTGAVVFNNSTTSGVSQFINGNTVFNNLTINRPVSTSKVRIKPGSRPGVRTALRMQGGQFVCTASPITLLSSATGTAYADDFSPGFTGTLIGQVTLQRFAAGLGASATQHQISSGVGGVSVSNFRSLFGLVGANNLQLLPNQACNGLLSNSPYSNLLAFDPNSVSSCLLEGYRTRTGGTLLSGTGYVASIPNNATLSFTGSYVTSASSTLINTSNVVQDGWNLIGNPFASAVNFNPPGSIDPTGLIYVPSGEYAGSYQPLSAGDPIASSQGFWVRKTAAGTSSYNFASSDRVTGNPTWFRKSSDNSVSLEFEANGYKDITTVRFDENASTGYDLGLDAGKFLSENGQATIYSLIRGEKSSINSIRNVEETPSVALNTVVSGNGTGVIRAKSILIGNDVPVILEDKLTARFTNLREQSEYVFDYNSNNAQTDSRFVLHFRSDVANSLVDIYSNNNTVYVDFSRLSTVDATITIYNVLGQEIAKGEANTSTVWSKELSVSDISYAIVRVKNGGEISTKKVFLGGTR